MKKPLTLVYGADETPPLGVTLACGVQHAALISIRLLFPLLVAREAGLGPERVLDVLAISMLVMSLAVYLQTLPSRPVGSGYLCPGSFTSAYVAPSLAAARTGGLGLVLGMTLFGGLVESALSRVIRPLRPAATGVASRRVAADNRAALWSLDGDFRRMARLGFIDLHPGP